MNFWNMELLLLSKIHFIFSSIQLTLTLPAPLKLRPNGAVQVYYCNIIIINSSADCMSD